MRRRLAVVLATLGLVAAFPVGSAIAQGDGPVAVAAKSCGSGFVHAVINGEEKCLRRGEFCTRSADTQYRRYGFRCVQYDANVSRYRLT